MNKFDSCMCGHVWLQAVLEKASIDEVYMDVTSLVDKELQARPRQSLVFPAPAASLHCSKKVRCKCKTLNPTNKLGTCCAVSRSGPRRTAARRAVSLGL